MVPGPEGPAGPACTPCSDGVSSFTTLTSSFNMPATDATVVAAVVTSLGFTIGQYVYIQNAGYLKVAAKPSAASLTLLNENYPGNAPAASVIANGSQIGPAGIKGLDGGVDFSTITTASFVMPDVNTEYATTFRARAANVATITTALSHNLTTGDYVRVASLGGAGYNVNIAQVTVTGATTFTYANAGGNEGATADTAGRITPNIQIEVETSLGFVDGQDVFIQDAGYFYLQEVPDITHMIVQNNGTANNETSGTTIDDGVRVSVSLNLNSLSPTSVKGQILVDDGANNPNANLTAMSPGTDGQVLASDSAQSNGRANVTIGPNSATDNAIPRFDGTTGKPVPLQTSLMLISDTGAIQSTPSGGNARGASAIDLQVSRSAGTQVASGATSVVAGGRNNTASATDSAVGGGTTNTASSSNATVAGGSSNSATLSGASVCGGATNSAGGLRSHIGGGNINTISAAGTYGVIAGGDSNSVTAEGGAIGGGGLNDVTAQYGTVAGGSQNDSTGTYATVAGGLTNVASGAYSSISGGREAIASLYGERAASSGLFAAAGDAQERSFISRKSTTNATPSELFLDGSSARMTIPNDTTWTFVSHITARRTDADDESAGYQLLGVIDRNANAASTALVGTVTKTVIGEDTAAWDVAATADTANGALIITVTGEAAKTIRWVASTKVIQTTG